MIDLTWGYGPSLQRQMSEFIPNTDGIIHQRIITHGEHGEQPAWETVDCPPLIINHPESERNLWKYISDLVEKHLDDYPDNVAKYEEVPRQVLQLIYQYYNERHSVSLS